jgi:transcriptional regulator with XRE-family HTH domain
MVQLAATAGVPMGFKENLRRLRESKKWSQAEAVRQAGVPFRSFVNWELGIREPRLPALARLAAAFKVSADRLLEGVADEAEEPKPPPRRGRRKK